jgi:hypothetical protein
MQEEGCAREKERLRAWLYPCGARAHPRLSTVGARWAAANGDPYVMPQVADNQGLVRNSTIGLEPVSTVSVSRLGSRCEKGAGALETKTQGFPRRSQVPWARPRKCGSAGTRRLLEGTFHGCIEAISTAGSLLFAARERGQRRLRQACTYGTRCRIPSQGGRRGAACPTGVVHHAVHRAFAGTADAVD